MDLLLMGSRYGRLRFSLAQTTRFKAETCRIAFKRHRRLRCNQSYLFPEERIQAAETNGTAINLQILLVGALVCVWFDGQRGV